MKNKKRVFAWLGILFIGGLFLALVIATFTGASENTILALLFCLFALPVLIYAFQLAARVTGRGKKGDDEE